ncbi:MAG: methylmalonyl Co-A mutase-associated GTPase MeaB [Synergistaceae bacterium]|nr:methylmalonyl Co-A mutase-associated GTPase MeaB [Synergistaceae bacterium]
MSPNKYGQPSEEAYVEGVLQGDRTMLSRAITLVESNAAKHFDMGQRVIRSLLPHTGKSVRVGITGVPGAGKSTFIEALGLWLCRQGHRVAVLAVDPSSSVSGGSILGDKTRMEHLTREPHAFIRPSPSGGTLGGLTRKSRETLLLCEAAGYDVILVETVGVGQGETTVRSMVDFFLLLVITGAGDELQGMKKGVMELADAVLVNKADGSNKLQADATRVDYERVLHWLRPATEGWTTRACTCSALEGSGIKEIWDVIQQFMRQVRESGVFDARRRQQTLSWVYGMIEERLQKDFYDCPAVASARTDVENKLLKGEISATQAAQDLLSRYRAAVS